MAGDARHVFLVGFMGAGKSTVGKMLAEKLGRPFVDLDARIEAAAGARVREVFEKIGESGFRRLERDALESLESQEPAVVACGGGIVTVDENRSTLRRLGVVVYLQVTSGEALARIGDVASRPLLAGPSGTLAATSLLAAREGLYRSVADVTVDTSGRTAVQVAEQAASLIGDLA